MVKFGRTTKRILLYTTAGIVMLALVLPLFLEQAVNTHFVKSRLSSYITEQTGLAIDSDQIDFRLSPRPRIGIRDIETRVAQRIRLRAKGVYAVLDGLKLMEGSIVVDRITVDGPDIAVLPPHGPAGKEIETVAPPASLADKVFDALPKGQETLELVLNQLKSDYFKTMNATLMVSKPDRTLMITADIRDLFLRKTDFTQTAAMDEVQLDAFASKEIRLVLRMDEKGQISSTIRCSGNRLLSKTLPEPARVETLDLGIRFSDDRMSARLKPASFQYPRGTVSIDFSYDTDQGEARAAFTGSQIDISQAGRATLAVAGGNEVVRELFTILRRGTAENIRVEFKNKNLETLFLDGTKMRLEGNAVGAAVKIPQTALIPDDISGTARVENGVLYIDARKGRLGANLIKSGRLELDLMNHRYQYPFNGEFTIAADLSTVPDLVISLLPHTQLAAELAGTSGIQGSADVVLGLEMGLNAKEPLVRVVSENIFGKGSYNRIPLPLSVSRGRFEYRDETAKLINVSGELGENPVQSLTARVDFSNDYLLSIDAKSADIRISDIFPWLLSYEKARRLVEPVKSIEGRMRIDTLSVRGPALKPDSWTYAARGSGRDIRLGFSRDASELQSMSGDFTVSDKRVNIDRITGKITDLAWLSPVVDPRRLDSIRMPVSAAESRLTISKQQHNFSGTFSFPSGPRLSFDLTGEDIKTMKPRTLLIKDKGVSDAFVMFNWNPHEPLLNFDGTLDTLTIEKLLVPASYLYGNLQKATGGQPARIHSDTSSNLHVKTPYIDLDAFLNKHQGDLSLSLFPQKNVFVIAERMDLKKRQFKNVEAHLFLNEQDTDIRFFKADLCDLDLTGNLKIVRQPPEQTRTHLSVFAEDKESLSKTLSCLFPGSKLIEGRFAFSCDLTGDAPLERINDSLNGRISLTAHNGRVYRLTLLSRLLSVLNLLDLPNITQEGFGFKTLTIQGEIKEGVIHLEKAVIDADDMALVFRGWVAPFKDDMKLDCLVAPFKTIDTIIKYIPIVSTMLKGTLVSFPARATGSLADPTVVPLHPSAVGKGLVNLATDIIKTPIRLFEPKD